MYNLLAINSEKMNCYLTCLCTLESIFLRFIRLKHMTLTTITCREKVKIKRPMTTYVMPQAFYYLHKTIFAQIAYPRSAYPKSISSGNFVLKA